MHFLYRHAELMARYFSNILELTETLSGTWVCLTEEVKASLNFESLH